MAIYYKFLGPNGEAIHGNGKWELPYKGHAGKWMPKIDNPVLCRSGYHVCEEKDLMSWLRPDCWLVEVRGPEIKGDDKSVFQEGRLLRKTHLDRTGLLLFAADCAERSLKFIKNEEYRKVVADTILVVRAFALGLASSQELNAAQNKAHDVRRKLWDAAAATYAAATNAAAAYAAAAYAAAAYAAYDAVAYAAAATYAAAAATYAAYDAYDAEARVKARADEKTWQINRLVSYIHGRIDFEALKLTIDKEFNQLKGK